MSELEELQKKLYTPEKPELPKETYIEPPVQSSPPPPVETAPEPESGIPSGAWKKIKIGLAVFLVLAIAVSVIVFFRGFYAFRKDKVVITLSGPETIVAGKTGTWKVSINNRNESELKEGELAFQYPDYSQPAEGGGLKEVVKVVSVLPGRTFEKEFKAVVIGGEGFERKSQAIFKFKPSSSNIVFESRAIQTTKISSFPVAIEINTPSETVSGESVYVSLNLKNESETDFKNLRARLEYPSGFKVKESSEKLYEFNNVWKVESVLPNETRNLTVKGDVTGIPREGKVFRAFIEGREGENWRVYKESGSETKLADQPLLVSIALAPDYSQNNLRPGKYVEYRVTWKNNLDVPLADMTLQVKLESDWVDFANVSSGGSFNSFTKTITWNKTNMSGLESIQPASEEYIDFNVKLKSKLSGSASNTIKAVAMIESASKPEGLAISKISATGELSLDISSD